MVTFVLIFQKAVVRGEKMKSCMADHVWRGKISHQLLWNKVKLLDKEEHWRVRNLKESVHMVAYEDLLSRPSVEINTVWEPLLKEEK